MGVKITRCGAFLPAFSCGAWKGEKVFDLDQTKNLRKQE
ncbi:Uncharacterized protein dnm_015820 [Desulfonema magnum]|uniref:Uncharacterized protein n=1 Tax=Desulfonema magnum TaxID=45655 RepID=A0A975GL83_9BACT|nr:Uncharacterized protein dnm_015820 [Desulfonema magnum]